MNQFFLQQGNSKELLPFAHILEFAIKRNNAVQLNSLNKAATVSIRIYYILEGKFEWVINDHYHILYPGDVVLIQPGHNFGGQKGVLDIGKLCWLSIEVNKSMPDERMMFGKWSSLPKNEILAIGKILRLCNTPVLSRVKETGRIFHEIHHELFNQQIGYTTELTS